MHCLSKTKKDINNRKIFSNNGIGSGIFLTKGIRGILVKNKELNNVLFLLLLSIGLFFSSASVSYSQLQIAQTVYGTTDSGYTAAGIGDADIESTGGTMATPDNLPPISATFNEPMDGTTLNSSTFTVRDNNGNDIPGTVSLGSDNRTVTFIPLSSLVYSSEYIATINTGARDLAGNPLPADNSWSFFTHDIEDNQFEDISDVSYYDTADNNITSSENVLTNDTEVGAPLSSYSDPYQQGQQQQQQQQQLINDNVSSSSLTSSYLSISEQPGTTSIQDSIQPSAALIPSESNNLSGTPNLNQSFPAFTPLTNTRYNSVIIPEQSGIKAQAGFTTPQQSDAGTISSSQPQQQQYQNNFPPYQQQYYQYPPQQPYQNQQFSYPSSNLTNNYATDSMGGIASPIESGATTILQQPPLQLSPTTIPGSLLYPDTSPPETYLNSAVDSNGLNVQSGAIVSSNLITITFEGVDDSGSIVDYQCSYDGQAYSCASPFTIDNSLALSAVGVPANLHSNSNSHTLLISAVDASGNIDQTPASFTWTILAAEEVSGTVTPPVIEAPVTDSTIVLPQEIQGSERSEYP